MRFPLPPGLPWLIEEICRDLAPIRLIRFDDTRGEVVTATRGDTDFPLQGITDFFAMICCAFFPQLRNHREGTGAKRLQSFDHYCDVFLVYELKQRRLSHPTIARQMWPRDFKIYEDQGKRTQENPTVHQVRNHLRLAAKLIHPPGK